MAFASDFPENPQQRGQAALVHPASKHHQPGGLELQWRACSEQVGQGYSDLLHRAGAGRVGRPVLLH